jgi:xylulose-5-phosphate/fructose-6-phosphate phosphoketolase
LGYCLSQSYGADLDNPNLIVAVVVGDGEAETRPLATSWHSNKFLNPVRDGAVLPILHLNGYKMANPTILARISHEELECLFKGYGYQPYFVEGSDPEVMYQKMAATLEATIKAIKQIKQEAHSSGTAKRSMWPTIMLRPPKGWTGPKEVDGKKTENFWRSNQVPLSEMHNNAVYLKVIEDWMKSYKPEEFFDENGTLISELQKLAPIGYRRMSPNPHANGGLIRKNIKMPDFRNYKVKVTKPGTIEVGNTFLFINFGIS